MDPIQQCIHKISPGNHFSYVHTGHTNKGDAICPPLHMAGHKNKTFWHLHSWLNRAPHKILVLRAGKAWMRLHKYAVSPEMSSANTTRALYKGSG